MCFHFFPSQWPGKLPGVRDYNKCGTATPGCSGAGWKACATKKFSNASKEISLLQKPNRTMLNLKII
jgi:hypothetical protein